MNMGSTVWLTESELVISYILGNYPTPPVNVTYDDTIAKIMQIEYHTVLTV